MLGVTFHSPSTILLFFDCLALVIKKNNTRGQGLFKRDLKFLYLQFGEDLLKMELIRLTQILLSQ